MQNISVPDWMTLLVFACFVLMAVAKLLNSQRFNEFIFLIVSNKYFLVQGKNTEIFKPFNVLLLLVQILSVSLFLFLLSTHFFESVTLQNTIIFIQITGFFTVFIGLKFYIEKLIANLFSIDSYINQYLYHKLTYRNLIAILLLVINMLFMYAINADTLAFTLVLVIVLLLNLVSLFYSYKTYEKLISKHLFYFILYLCALEISPYFIIYKIVMTQ
ncbi:DUF4271 domain-containing protein [uncultured Planktosalinus sp.]|uniref:DUF4271 domain-containing protein n=1 Tax=uncultured Planktosalinus sp. TaxID=1810935 RepID=UPI0030DD05DD